MTFSVYVLYSQTFQKYYTGYTSNLEMRLKSHNEFGKGWTSKYRPWRIIFSKEFETKTEAMKFEAWLKTGIGRDFINSIKID
jgi:putative endonuclease